MGNKTNTVLNLSSIDFNNRFPNRELNLFEANQYLLDVPSSVSDPAEMFDKVEQFILNADLSESEITIIMNTLIS